MIIYSFEPASVPSRSLDVKANYSTRERKILSQCLEYKKRHGGNKQTDRVEGEEPHKLILIGVQGRGSTPIDLDLTFYPSLVSRVLIGLATDLFRSPVSVFPNIKEKKLKEKELKGIYSFYCTIFVFPKSEVFSIIS